MDKINLKTLQGFKTKATEDKPGSGANPKPEIKQEVNQEDQYNGQFQVYDLRDSDLEKIDLADFTNSVIFFSSGDFVDELKQFEEALDRQDGILNMTPRKYFNFFVVTNNECSPMLKEMVIREENSLEHGLKYPCPIVLDVHGKLGTHFQMFDDKEQKEVFCFLGIGIEGSKLFELHCEDMDIVAREIKKLIN